MCQILFGNTTISATANYVKLFTVSDFYNILFRLLHLIKYVLLQQNIMLKFTYPVQISLRVSLYITYFRATCNAKKGIYFKLSGAMFFVFFEAEICLKWHYAGWNGLKTEQCTIDLDISLIYAVNLMHWYNG